MAIVDKALRYIVPFKLQDTDMSFEELCSKVDNHIEARPFYILKYCNPRTNKPLAGRWKRKKVSDKESDVYSYIADSMGNTENGLGEGCCWDFVPGRQNAFNFLYWKDEREISFHINGVTLCLFRTNVGFLWFDIETDEGASFSEEDLISFQYDIKELNHGNGKMPYTYLAMDADYQVPGYSFPEAIKAQGAIKAAGNEQKGSWKTSDKVTGTSSAAGGEPRLEIKVPVYLGGIIAEWLKFLEVKYFASRSNHNVKLLKKYFDSDNDPSQAIELEAEAPDKAVLFSFASYYADEPDREFDEYFSYQMSSGFNDRYQISDLCRREMLHVFDNVTIYATNQGCGYYARVDASNQKTFENIIHIVMSDYFALYLKVLYQSYSVLRFSEELASEKMPFDYMAYVRENVDTQMGNLLKDTRARINLFLVKNVTASVSHIYHQNKFYSYLEKQLGIHEDIVALTNGLDALDELYNQQANKQTQTQGARFQKGLGYLACLSVASALADSLGFFTDLKEFELDGNVLMWIWVVVALVIAVVFILALRITVFMKADK